MILQKDEIKKCLPQREPFLMVDRVVDFDEKVGIVAELDLPESLPFFKGHFPNMPIMPGVLMTEALAQTCGLYVALAKKNAAGGNSGYAAEDAAEDAADCAAGCEADNPSGGAFGGESGELFFLASSNIKFKSVVRAGATLTMKAQQGRGFGGLYSFSANAYNGRELAATGTIVLASKENVKL